MSKETDMIRAAHQKGNKTVELNGRLFKLKARTKHVNMKLTDGTIVDQDETWISASPADGSYFPCYNVEAGNNSRVTGRKVPQSAEPKKRPRAKT
jgi:hypothetical protein